MKKSASLDHVSLVLTTRPGLLIWRLLLFAEMIDSELYLLTLEQSRFFLLNIEYVCSGPVGH